MTYNNDMKKTIKEMINLGLYTYFYSSMQTLVENNNKPQEECDNKEFNSNGLEYNYNDYKEMKEAYDNGELDEIEEVKYFQLGGIHRSRYNKETFKSDYYNGYKRDFMIDGLDFGFVIWNPRSILKKYNDFIKKEESVDVLPNYEMGDYYYENDLNDDDNKYSKGDYYNYIERVLNVDYSCFYGMLPKQILDILNIYQ